MKIEKSGVIDPKLVTLNDRFVNAFEINKQTKKNIVESMLKNGYDKTQPIIITHILNTGKKFLIDGHSRRQSSIEAGLIRIPYIIKEFNTEDEAFNYIKDLQFNRRNLTEKEKLEYLLYRCDVSKAKNKKKYIAEKLHVGERTAVKYLKILNDNDRLQLVLNDEETINSAIKAKSEKQTERKVVKDIKKIARSIPDDMTVEELEILDQELKAIRKRLREVRR